MCSKIEIIGSGTVGIALGRAFSDRGFSVHFTDVRLSVVCALRDKGYSASIGESAPAAEIHFLCVPTPTTNGIADYTSMRQACRDLARRMAKTKDYHLVVVKSTVLPGTTDTLVVPSLMETSNLRLGSDLGVCVSPEFLREKTACSDALHPPLTVIGENDKRAGDVLAGLFKGSSSEMMRMSIREAEMMKYVHNIFNAVKISFFNEMRGVIRGQGLDAEKIFKAVAKSCEGIWNPEYGMRDRGPYEGSCLPKDVRAFLSWASETGNDMRILRAAMEANDGLLLAGKANADRRGEA